MFVKYTLRPTLFLAYSNDLQSNFYSAETTMYDDNTTIISIVKFLPVHNEIQNTSNKYAHEWFISNKLTIKIRISFSK